MKLKKALDFLCNGKAVRRMTWAEDCYIRYDVDTNEFYFSSTEIDMETKFSFTMSMLQADDWVVVAF